MSILRCAFVVLAVAAVAAPAPSGAQEAAPRPGAVMGACQADMERLCADVPAGGGGRLRCLREKRDEASPACQAQLEPAQREGNRERLAEARAECRGDVERLCADVRPGGGAVIRCLRANQEKLSDGCREAMAPPAP